MKYIGTFLIGLMLCLPGSLNAQEGEAPVRILFVGNSFTFFWNMPQLVGAMAKIQGFDLETRQSTVSGSTLEHHWKGERGSRTRELIETGDWDYIIFGGHSRATLDAPERFGEYGEKFARLAREQGAEPIFYMTWAYKSNPLMQETITKGYMDLGSRLGAEVLAVGPVFARARRLRPDLELFFDDKHPSPDGSYLIALTITKLLTDTSVATIPNRLTMEDSHGEKLYLSFVLPPTGDFLRTLVDTMDFKPYTIKK